MRLAVVAVVAFFTIVALASVLAVALLEEADDAGDVWTDDEVES